MTRLQAVILTAVFALAGCIDDGLDEPEESTDNEDCTPVMAWAFCDSPIVEVTLEEMNLEGVRCGVSDVVYVIEGYGAIWSRTCEFVCLSECE